MIYVSIDIETTSLIPRPDHVLQVAMIREDTELADITPVEDLPTFSCFVSHEEIKGQAYALQMNAWILKILAGVETEKVPRRIIPKDAWEERAEIWLSSYCGDSPVVAAGKNVAGFDMQFFTPEFRKRFAHRTIDVGSVFIDWAKAKPLSLGDIIGHSISHDAVDDARDVIRALRKKYARTGA